MKECVGDEKKKEKQLLLFLLFPFFAREFSDRIKSDDSNTSCRPYF